MREIVLFLFKAIVFWLIWQVFYEYILINTSLDQFLVMLLGESSALLLRILGFEAYFSENILRIGAVPVVFVHRTCNGQDLFALNMALALAYPLIFRQKISLIFWGTCLVLGLNVWRVALLALNYYYTQSSFDFNHHYTFPLLVYAALFLLWKFYLNPNQNSWNEYWRNFGVLFLVFFVLVSWQSRAFFSEKIALYLSNYAWGTWADTFVYAFWQILLVLSIFVLYFWKNQRLFRLFACGILLLLGLCLLTTIFHKIFPHTYFHFLSEQLIYFYFSPYPWVLGFGYGFFNETKKSLWA